MKNTLFDKAFEVMEGMGWNVEDFQATLNYHVENMLFIANAEERDVTYMCQFMLDFLEAINTILKEVE